MIPLLAGAPAPADGYWLSPSTTADTYSHLRELEACRTSLDQCRSEFIAAPVPTEPCPPCQTSTWLTWGLMGGMVGGLLLGAWIVGGI